MRLAHPPDCRELGGVDAGVRRRVVAEVVPCEQPEHDSPCAGGKKGEPLGKSLLDCVAPVSRRTLHGDLVERIRDMIIEGKLAPGARINEGVLGGQLGVSRTPLREAIKFVASEGLIELVPGRGAVIRKLTAKEVREMLEFLSWLEAIAGRKACLTASDAQIGELRVVHDAMMGFYQARDRLEYYKLNQAIHTGIVRLGGNGFLAAQHEAAQARLKRIRFLGNEAPAKWKGAVAEHATMIAALEARDGERLAGILIQHLDNTWSRVEKDL